MSPQISRLSGHYALAYCFVVPWFVYVSFIYAEKPSLKRSAWVFIAIAAISSLHLYYFLMAAAYIGFYYLIEAFRRKNQPLWKYSVAFLVQVLLPFLLYMLWMKSTDMVSDRPNIPYGMLEYMALWEGVFLPFHFYHDSTIFQTLGVRFVNSEAIAYVGWPATIYFIYFLLSRLKVFFYKKKMLTLLKSHSIFFAGFLVFLMAATLPFLLNTPFGEKYGGPLLQFRSLGRLSWVIFYTLNIFMFVQFAGTRKRIGMIISTLATLVLIFQGLRYNADYSDRLGQKIQPIAGQELLLSYGDHVIFPLPYFHIGSENISSPIPDEYMAGPTMALSLSSGLPTFASMMSRTSLSQTLNLFEMAYNLSGPLMEEDKPWMVLKSPSYSNRVSSLLPPAIFSIDNLQAHSVKATQWKSWKENQRRVDSLKNDMLYYASFDDRNAEGLANSRGAGFTEESDLLLYEGPGFQDTADLSIWINAKNDGFRFFHIRIENTKTGENWQLEPGSNFDNIMDGFARVVIRNQLLNFPCKVSLYNSGPLHVEFVADECVIQKSKKPYQYTLNGYQFTEEFVFKPVQ